LGEFIGQKTPSCMKMTTTNAKYFRHEQLQFVKMDTAGIEHVVKECFYLESLQIKFCTILGELRPFQESQVSPNLQSIEILEHDQQGKALLKHRTAVCPKLISLTLTLQSSAPPRTRGQTNMTHVILTHAWFVIPLSDAYLSVTLSTFTYVNCLHLFKLEIAELIFTKSSNI
ncbi:hypothetical protein BGZ83_012149, partial [Gryganskiella cystojenkinii]